MIYRLISLLLATRRALWRYHRRDRGPTFVLVTAGALVFDLVLAVVSVSTVIGLFALGAPLFALLILGLVGWLVLPHVVIERVAIPLGWHRFAATLAAFDPRGDREAWPTLCAARALARRGAPPEATAWLAQHCPARLDGTSLAAWAFVAHGRGDRDDARRLLRSLADLADPAPEARGLAGEWLALDAAERGAWRELVDDARTWVRPGRGAHRQPSAIDRARAEADRAGLASDGKASDRQASDGPAPKDPIEPLWPATPLAFLLEGVGARLLGRVEAPSQLGLWLRWLIAPRRLATLPLVRAAARPPVFPPAATAATAPSTSATASSAATPAMPPPIAPELHAAAIAAHARALTDPSPATVAAAVAVWSAVVDDPDWPAAQRARADALGVSPALATAATAAARDQLVTSLVELAVAARTTAVEAGSSPLAAAVATRARSRILDGLELSLGRAHDRIKAREELSALDEWRAFLALRAAYLDAAAAGGPELDRVAFPHADEAFGAWTVWLWNTRGQHLASHAISAWLYERALAVGDAAAIELHGRNAALHVP